MCLLRHTQTEGEKRVSFCFLTLHQSQVYNLTSTFIFKSNKSIKEKFLQNIFISSRMFAEDRGLMLILTSVCEKNNFRLNR